MEPIEVKEPFRHSHSSPSEPAKKVWEWSKDDILAFCRSCGMTEKDCNKARSNIDENFYTQRHLFSCLSVTSVQHMLGCSTCIARKILRKCQDINREAMYKIPTCWTCPICHNIMRDPVRLQDSVRWTFCRACIDQWLKIKADKPTNPLTGEILPPKPFVVPHRGLDDKIGRRFDKVCREKERKVCSSGHVLLSSEEPAECAKDAEKFYDENFRHLIGQYSYRGRAVEIIQNIRRRVEAWCPASRESANSVFAQIAQDGHHDVDLAVKEGQAQYESIANDDPLREQRQQEVMQNTQNRVDSSNSFIRAVIGSLSSLWKSIIETTRTVGTAAKSAIVQMCIKAKKTFISFLEQVNQLMTKKYTPR